MSEIALRPLNVAAARRVTLTWVAVALVIAATALFSISNLLWTVREGIQPLSANSEFFAYSWIYAVRWAHGESHIFMPHTQILFCFYGLIDWLFTMTAGGAERVIQGWRTISLVWPIVMMIASLALLFGTADRRNPTLDVLLCAALYLYVIQRYLSDQALNSLSYHSLAIPVAFISLPLWTHYVHARRPALHFYIGLGLYTALCALGKPTFLAFATPFFAMETARLFQDRNLRQLMLLIAAGVLAVSSYFLFLFLFFRGIEGVEYHLRTTYSFMASQASQWEAVKGTSLYDWYNGYIIPHMAWMPALLIVSSIAVAVLSPQPVIVTIGVIVGVLSSLFCFYQRTQMHAEPEFLAMLLVCALGAFRASGLAGRLMLPTGVRTLNVVGIGAAVLLVVFTALHPPTPRLLTTFSTFMSDLDKASVPATFKKNAKTIVLATYPYTFYGVIDAWCRGSAGIASFQHSRLFDDAMGDDTCIMNSDDPSIDISKFDRVVIPRVYGKNGSDSWDTVLKVSPRIAARIQGCHSLGAVTFETDRYETWECSISK